MVLCYGSPRKLIQDVSGACVQRVALLYWAMASGDGCDFLFFALGFYIVSIGPLGRGQRIPEWENVLSSL